MTQATDSSEQSKSNKIIEPAAIAAGSFKPVRLIFAWLKPCHKAVKCGGAYIAADNSAADDDKVHSDVIKRVSAVIGVIGYNICILYCVLALIQR